MGIFINKFRNNTSHLVNIKFYKLINDLNLIKYHNLNQMDLQLNIFE
jgi:hypothetical protein